MAFNWFGLRKSPIQTVDAPARAIGLSAGEYVTTDTAMEVSAFYSGVMYLTTQIAKLPFYVKDDKNNILYTDKVTKLLNLSPNKEVNSFYFRLTLMQDAITNGNGYAEIERDVLGRPVALWHIPAINVEPYRTVSGELIYRVIGGSTVVSGQDAWLQSKDVFHIKNFHTKDGIVGQGLIAYAKNTLGISISADKHAGNLFANGGMPSGVLEIAGALSQEAFNRIRDSWKQAHSGRRSGGVAILENGAKYTAASMDPTLMQFLESRIFSVDEIARFLRVPPSKLYSSRSGTAANAENANLEVATDTLDAWAKAFEIEADVKLLNNQYLGRRAEINLYDIFRGDMASRSSYFSKMMQMAAISPNEIREKEGLPGYEGGDRFYVAINNFTPADRIDEVLDAQVNPKQAASVDPEDNNNKSEADDEVKKAILDYITRR